MQRTAGSLFGAAACSAAALLIVSCSQVPPARIADPSFATNRFVDAQYGYPGSPARIDADGRLSITAVSRAASGRKGMLRTAVSVTNTAQHAIRLEYGSCPVQIQVFTDKKRKTEPVWDSFGAGGFRCNNAMSVRDLLALEDITFEAFTNTNVLADSLGGGKYYLSALVRPNGVPLNVPAGELDL